MPDSSLIHPPVTLGEGDLDDGQVSVDEDKVKAHYGALLLDKYMQLLTGPGSESLWRNTVQCKGPHGTHKGHEEWHSAVGSC